MTVISHGLADAEGPSGSVLCGPAQTGIKDSEKYCGQRDTTTSAVQRSGFGLVYGSDSHPEGAAETSRADLSLRA